MLFRSSYTHVATFLLYWTKKYDNNLLQGGKMVQGQSLCVRDKFRIWYSTYGRSRPDGYLNKKLGIFALLYFHNVNYTTTLLFLN